MNSLFNEYKQGGKIREALLVGRNMVNRNPGDLECVEAYVDFLLLLAENLPVLDERKAFMNQADVTLSFYEENADLDTDIILKIGEYRERISILASEINKLENEKAQSALEQIVSENTSQIKQLYKIKQKLQDTKDKKEFDGFLKEISLVDAKIEHDYMTDEQKAHYDQLNRECTDCISGKMRELEYIKNVAYNKKAVDAFDSAFKKFKNNENTYKNQTQLFSLVSSTLFAYDAGRLFNETLIYYNHVYSYIFSKLDEDGKFALTRFSIECERKQR